MQLTPHGRPTCFHNNIGHYRTPLVYADFEIRRDGENTWKIYCPGKHIKYPVADFTGTAVEAQRALKLLLVTQRLLK